MHAVSIVARVVGPCLRGLHAKRAAACQRAVVAVVLGAALSLSGVALGMRSATGYRHRVKSMDRLLGNGALHAVRTELYAALAARWLTGVGQLLLVIDWSDLTPDQRWHGLRASVAVEGRSVTLYEEVHPQRRLGNLEVHRQFLARVAELLPPGCKPIVMTDAGFHSTWSKAVSAQGWAFIGRIRGRDMVQRGAGPWIPGTALYGQATEQARDLGPHAYAQRMRIEQSFRDTKNLRLGQGLSITRSRTRERLQTLLLIGHLAAFVQRLIGEAAKARQLELNFMATHRRTRPEISTLTLARRILLSVSPCDWLDRLAPWAAIPPLRVQAINACAPA